MNRYVSIAVLAVLAVSARAWGDPVQVNIEITDVPPSHSAGNVRGIVTGASGTPTDYRVATYIQVEGGGWWVKPLDTAPLVSLNADWTFSVPIGTSGLDEYATIYHTALVDAGHTPPISLGSNTVPRDAGFLATDSEERYCHMLNKPFGVDRTTGESLTWGAKHAPMSVGPGRNLFYPENASVDDNGRLHLEITQESPTRWAAAEVMMTRALGYGDYLFQTSTDVDTLDSKAVFGAFTWDAYGDGGLASGWQNREIDLTEDSRSDIIPSPHDSQYVVQPWYLNGHRHSYDLDESQVTRVMIWRPNRLEFYTLAGHHTLDTWETAAVIESWTDYSGVIPEPGEARLRFNLWLFPPAGWDPPTAGGDGALEFIVDHFEFDLVSPPGDTNWDDLVDESDYENLIAQFGGAPGAQSADLNGDGRVDLADFVIMRGNFDPTLGSSVEPGATAPEPGAMTVMLIGALALVRKRKPYCAQSGSSPARRQVLCITGQRSRS